MRHAGSDSLARLEPLLQALRAVPGLTERRPGVFYRRSAATLHFHQDPTGLYADLKEGGEWVRYAVNTEQEQAALSRATGKL